MSIQQITVPDLGGANDVEVIEVSVAVGDELALEDAIVTVETDKASMEVPCTVAGKVVAVHFAEGDKLNEGDVLIDLEVAVGAAEEPEAAIVEVAEVPAVAAQVAAAAESAPVAKSQSQEVDIVVPDLGGADNVDVIEVCVAKGDEVGEGDSLIVVETDKASMEIPANSAGKLIEFSVNEGDKISQGDVIGRLLVESVAVAAPAAPAESLASAPAKAATSPAAAPAKVEINSAAPVESKGDGFYAGPAVRQLARQLAVELKDVKGSGPRARLTKDDIRSYAKAIISDVKSGKINSGAGIPAIPEVDFSRFGEIELVKMSKIKKLTAANMSRNWLNVPHVTQFDDADITDLEVFRKSMKAEAEKRGIKLSPMPFLIKAVAAALRAEPSFNVSLHADGEHMVQKDYVHIGIAADTPAGLLVPVLRDADKKGIWEIAEEVNELVGKARAGKLTLREMQGSCFTISSLGAMGGKGFTPIVNAPEVGILGVSKASMQPVWNGSEFIPRQLLPLSLSYDHRAINGVDCGRFFGYLVSVLSDIRRLVL